MQGADLIGRGFYFFFPGNTLDAERLHYNIAALAEGLRRLGARLFSNVQAPPPFPPSFFTVKPMQAADGHTFIYAASEDSYSGQLAVMIGEFPAARKFILSMADNCQWFPVPPNVPSLFPHASRFFTLPGERLPWPFGLTDARAALCGAPPAFETRRPVLIRNFRPSYPQGIRHALDLALLPHLERHFTIDRAISTNTAHYRGLGGDHFERLRTSIGCLAYCGEMSVDLRDDPGIQKSSMGALSKMARFTREPVVIRWDSWRFWESLACGCLTFHLDLEKYGCWLPEMPVAWKHYIPVDFEDCKGTVERFLDERGRWAEISEAGRAWALEHYASDAVTRRFLGIAAGHRPRA